jgi:hypothetical protein
MFGAEPNDPDDVHDNPNQPVLKNLSGREPSGE